MIGCGKAEQAQNDGFCRTHFNEFAITDGMDEDMSEKWTCECGNEWSVRQKRCGNTRCQKVSYFFQIYPFVRKIGPFEELHHP